ncbi:MAG: class I SAM-dependent methyltransferase [candidate division Zixibacteria bacterium]|nr:class I SAM-dependent methyltransferase [candidate division Zixibacteria bacterium]
MKLNGQKLVLDFGCGRAKHPGTIGADLNRRSSADVITDLNRLPYPFKNDSFDQIICKDILEHLDNFIGVMEELHRITKPGGAIHVHAPFASSPDLHADPTHRRGFVSKSFDYFIEGTPAYAYRYSDVHFHLNDCRYSRPKSFWFDPLILKWANRNKSKFEGRLLFWYPVSTIEFELEVVK